MTIIYNTPYQKIFIKKQNLNNFLLKILDLLTYKKIDLQKNLKINKFHEDNYKKEIKDIKNIDIIEDLDNETKNHYKYIKKCYEDTNIGKKHIKIYKIDRALFETNWEEDKWNEHIDLKGLIGIKFQNSDIGLSLMNLFNLRFLIGFKIQDLFELFKIMEFNEKISSTPNKPNYIFLFTNIDLWPYQKTWRLTISRGNIDSIEYNILAQDLISDYFQNTGSIFVPKIDYIKFNEQKNGKN